MSATLEQLQSVVGRLHGLLQDPQEGLMTWNQALANRIEELAIMWYGADVIGRSKSDKVAVVENSYPQ